METKFTSDQCDYASSSARSHSTGIRQEPDPCKWRRRAQWCTVILPFLFLWVVLINQLRVEWQVNPQYAHGWVVPFLCLALLSLRWSQPRANGAGSGVTTDFSSSDGAAAGVSGRKTAVFLIGLLVFLWLPTRLVQEANPEWRMISWMLAVEVIGLTLTSIWLRADRDWAGRLAFPLCFFLVAVPWPTVVEGPLIQTLTSICASLSVEVVGWLGIPAVQHGNVLEVVTGTVGIDEACSGIRSFQSTLMISLFLGDFYGLSIWRRIALVPSGFLLALLFNIGRIAFLTTVAARKGVPAISEYHDPAGIAIMVGCVFSLWLLALAFRGRTSPPAPVPARPAENASPPSPALKHLAWSLLIWLILVEAGVEAWYGIHEWRVAQTPTWSVLWPRTNPTYTELPIAERAKWLLRYDEEVSASWRGEDGTKWQMIYLRWLPGRVAVHLAKLHTPEVCMAAAGHTVETLPELTYLTIHGLSMPFRKYVLHDGVAPAYVFYCLWEDRAQVQFFKTQLLTYGNRLGPVLAGRRNNGQRSLEIVISGFPDIHAAEDAVVRELNNRIKVSDAGVKADRSSS